MIPQPELLQEPYRFPVLGKGAVGANKTLRLKLTRTGHPLSRRVVGVGSLCLDISRPNDLAPFFGVVGNKLPEIGGRACNWCVAEVRNPCLKFGIGQSGIDLLVEL